MIVRTRFAPSPTGFMHVGNVRTALYAWLLARQSGGQFILRIEDTDQARKVEGSVEHIIKTLQWLGINPDESPVIGGPHSPYVQSQRLDSYKPYAQKLIEKGLAYADPYTPEEVEEFRKQAQAEKRPFLYRNHRPKNPPKWDGTQPLRFKVAEPKTTVWQDAVRGKLSAGPEALDDFVLIKSDGFPTYNFAHIIDDLEMKVTHVMRSDEFLASTPKFIALYEALEITPPILAILPPIMAPDGRRKLGKRDGAKDVLDYKNEGFMPETILNFLASLGWNDATEQEIFTVTELIEKFSLDHVQRSGSQFDVDRLIWMSGQHIRKLNTIELYERVQDFWPQSAQNYDEHYKKAVLRLVHERLKFFSELPQLTSFFFEEPEWNESLIEGNKQLKKLSTEDQSNMLKTTVKTLEDSDFTEANLEEKLRALVGQLNTKPGILFGLIRAAITGSNIAPGLFETMQVLGKDRVLDRIRKAA